MQTTGFERFNILNFDNRYEGYSKNGFSILSSFGSMSPIIQSSNIANGNELINIYVLGVVGVGSGAVLSVGKEEFL